MSSQLLDSPIIPTEPERVAGFADGTERADHELGDCRGASRLDLVAGVEAEIADVAGVLNSAHARLVRLIERTLAEDLWCGDGFRTVEHWLCLRAGVSSATARQVVALARRTPERPVLSETCEAGRLSLDQASAVAAKTPPEYEKAVTEFAVHASVSQIRRALARYPFTTDPEEDAAAKARCPTRPDDPPKLRLGSTEHGRRWLRFEATPDTMAVIEGAVREAKDALFAAGDTDATLADGLIEVAARSLGAASPPRRSRYRVLFHLDIDQTRSWWDAGWVDRGDHLPPDVVRRFTCDGTVQPVWERDGIPVSVGRSQRTVPSRTRRLVLDRDRGCRYPGCGVTGGFVEVHHLIHWADGGPTDLANLIALCPRHHAAHHTGVFTITGKPNAPGGLTFATSHGDPITPTPPRPPTHGADPPGGGAYRPPTGERCDMNQVYFTPNTPEVEAD